MSEWKLYTVHKKTSTQNRIRPQHQIAVHFDSFAVRFLSLIFGQCVLRLLSTFIMTLYKVYKDLFFTYLEINPLGKTLLAEHFYHWNWNHVSSWVSCLNVIVELPISTSCTVVVVVAALSSLVRILGECSTIHSHAGISPQWVSELRWLWRNVPWQVFCELVSR